MLLERYLENPVTADLVEKMVLVAGPRQVGKTTLAQEILRRAGPGLYLSWDRREDRQVMRAAQWPADDALVVLDEIHKYRGWKRWLKGEYDHHRGRLRFLVTGSARLDLYRRGGDSLQGRYHHYRLHPLSYAEVEGAPPLPLPGSPLDLPARARRATLDALLQFGGFPEPFLAASTRTHRRWQRQRLDRFFREDVRDLEAIRDLASLELLADLLTRRVASPLSLNALREDLEVSHRAVTHWVEILERLYFIFRVRPFAARGVRSLRQMAKAYLWDASVVPEAGPRFENLMALHLLKLCHLLEDQEGHRVELCYLRDRDGREVDFLVVTDGAPWLAVEVKRGGTAVSSALRYFVERLEIPYAYQVSLEGRRDFLKDGIRVVPAARFLAALA